MITRQQTKSAQVRSAFVIGAAQPPRPRAGWLCELDQAQRHGGRHHVEVGRIGARRPCPVGRVVPCTVGVERLGHQRRLRSSVRFTHPG